MATHNHGIRSLSISLSTQRDELTLFLRTPAPHLCTHFAEQQVEPGCGDQSLLAKNAPHEMLGCLATRSSALKVPFSGSCRCRFRVGNGAGLSWT
jgi:hypothetical protein